MKRINLIFTLLSLLTVFLIFHSCRENKEIVPSPEFAAYISAYTGGNVSSGSTIRIELARELSGVELHSEIKEKLFSFSPSIKGKASWVSNKVIEFVPDSGQLKADQLYTASFQLDKVMKVEKKFKKFPFSFHVIPQSFAIETSPYTTMTATDPKKVMVEGTIRFMDMIAIDKVRTMLSARLDGEAVSLKVVGTADPKQFHFTIENIERSETKNRILVISGDGKSVGIDKDVEHKVEIESMPPFRYLDVEVFQGDEKGVEITFSDPLDLSQDLRGLIDNDTHDPFTYQIDRNKVKIFFERTNMQSFILKLNKGIKNFEGKTLKESTEVSISFESMKPMIDLPFSGNILPDSKNLVFPFRVVNLWAVDLKIIRIFEKNVLMFMQNNNYSGNNEIRRSGRLIYKETVRLDNEPGKNLGEWNNFSIDLSKIIKQEPGAIYKVEFSFKQAYSLYPCGGMEPIQPAASSGLVSVSPELSEEDEAEWDTPQAYYSSGDNIDWDEYNWEEKDDPCKSSYYMGADKMVSCNILASNVGIIVKRNNDKKIWVTVNDILTTDPLSGCELRAYNYQLQEIGSAKTDGDGFATIDLKGKPFILVAQSGEQKGYLRLVDGEENSLSRFDIGGKSIQKGLKGFIYGERGVWRPGDTLYLTFVLEDKLKKIPENHPVALEVYNPKGQFYTKQVSVKSLHGFYTFEVATGPDDPTGLWNAYVKVGGASFHKSLRVEAIKPNRLKINLEVPGNRLDAGREVPVELSSSWLTGATARNLKVKVEMSLSKVNTQFKGYENYTFNNPATSFESNDVDVFDGSLNEEGNVRFSVKAPQAQNAPGLLKANIISRVFEPGGDASTYIQTVPFSPFSSYVGLNFRLKNDQEVIETDKDRLVDIVTLNADGKPVSRRNLDYRIYRLSWSWWWENDYKSLDRYLNGTSSDPVEEGTLSTVNGKGTLKFRIDYPSWGRYLVYVKDTESGHATGKLVYVDWPESRGRSQKSDPDGLTMLSFSTNKSSYEVGEDVSVIIPGGAGGRALVAIENGSSVLKREWVKTELNGDTRYSFKVTEEMAPNFYIHISLLQPHAQTENNLPIRLYGVVPVSVSNKNSELFPEISMPAVLRPEKEFTVSVKERAGRPMTYTLAVVDEGLLDLTAFKTPDIHSEFYAREALGIRTWDLYNYVIGAFGGKMGSLLSIGGDEALKPVSNRANRFKPVVKFIGPFHIGKGGIGTHSIKLPPYIGSVRVMVVAGQDGAYGKAEKTAPVRSPLMVLSTLPRVTGTGEDIRLPVTVFAMENTVKNVSVKVETSGLLQLVEGSSRQMKFSKPGDDLVFFRLKAGSKTGVEKVKITATGNGQTSTETIEIQVRNPNPPIIRHENKMLSASESTTLAYSLSGQSNDNWVKLELSRLPSVDLSRRFDYLENYEHCCSEQLTSKAFPLLYVGEFKDLSKTESELVKKNVREAIRLLYARQYPSGGFVYWPGQSDVNDWITSYVGHFLNEAQQKGYEVNSGVIAKWKNYQRKAAQNWTAYNREGRFSYYQEDLQQAYRLYTLALSGSPELGSMNRMKENKNLSVQAKWRLAAAYAMDGKKKAANELIFNATTAIDPYTSSNSTYGSYERDDAMILETMVLLGEIQKAFTQAQRISKNLSSQHYFSTQSTAYSLLAMGKLAEKMLKGQIDVTWKVNDKQQPAIKSARPVYQVNLPASVCDGSVNLKNNGAGNLFVSLTSKTQPVEDTLATVANNLKLEVSYADMNGKPVDPSRLSQGTDFVVSVKVSNISGGTNYTDLALTHIFPSGWEIFNERMMTDNGVASDEQQYTYKDIRDDRVLTYFDLPYGKHRIFKVRLQAAYGGRFVLPAVQCEAMYDTQAQARTTAGWVEVVNE